MLINLSMQANVRGCQTFATTSFSENTTSHTSIINKLDIKGTKEKACFYIVSHESRVTAQMKSRRTYQLQAKGHEQGWVIVRGLILTLNVTY